MLKFVMANVSSVLIQMEVNSMSCLQNEMLLETLFEEALEEVTNNNHLQFNDAELQFNAEVIAQQRFEDMCQ